MNATGLSDAVIIAIVIFVLIIIIALFFAIYIYWGTTTGTVLIVITVLLFFIVAAIAIYVYIYKGASSSGSTPPGTTPPGPTPPGPTPPGPTPPGPTPPGSTPISVKFGDIVALDNPSVGVGTTVCNIAQGDLHAVVSSPTMRNKVWVITGGTANTNLTYGATFTLQNNISGYPLTRMTTGQSTSGTHQLVIPTTGQFVTFIVNKAPGNTSTSTIVMYGDLITLTVMVPLSPPIGYIMILDSGESPGGTCGNNIDLISPIPTIPPSFAIWMFN